MSLEVLQKLRDFAPNIFIGPYGGAVSQAVFSYSRADVPGERPDVHAEANALSGVQILVGGSGNDRFFVDRIAGNTIVFSTYSLQTLVLPEVRIGGDWMVGRWFIPTSSGLFGIEGGPAGWIFYNTATDQTITTVGMLHSITLGPGLIDRIGLQLQPHTIDRLDAAGAWLGILRHDDLVDEGFLPGGGTPEQLLQVYSFFLQKPHMLLDDGIWRGSNYDDSLRGTEDRDVIYALRGDDTVRGNGGDDLIWGGPGNDILHGGQGDDVLIGGEGNDSLLGGPGNDTLVGGDYSEAFAGHNTLDGGAGENLARFSTEASDAVAITGNAENQRIMLRDGATFELRRIQHFEFQDTTLTLDAALAMRAQVFTGNMSDNTSVLGMQFTGRRLVELEGGNNLIGGGPNNDTLIGAAGNDTLRGLAGDNLLRGVAGDNLLTGGAGKDTFHGGTGNDTVWGGAGEDLILFVAGGDNEAWAGAGNDTLTGGNGADTLGGGPGDDYVEGGYGVGNQLWGGAGNDTIWSNGLNALAGGGPGEDLVHGGEGADTLMGGLGNDTVNGWGGDDVIFLGMGNDMGYGGDGNDTLVPGPGFDRLWGGLGADRFEFWRDFGWNRVEDFDISEGDMIAVGRGMLTAVQGELTTQKVIETYGRINPAGDVILDFASSGTTVVLVGLGVFDGLADHILIL